MKPMHPLLKRTFSLAHSTPPAPSQRLEILVISAWREQNMEPEFTAIYHSALACACGLLVLVFVASYGLLTEPENPTILLANAALHEAIHP